MENPRKLVATAFELANARDYNALAALCDPLSLRSFKAEMLEEHDYEALAATPVDPDAPRIELTDEQYADYCKYVEPVRQFQLEFPRLEAIGDLRNLEPLEAFAVWMDGKAHHGLREEETRADAWKDLTEHPEQEIIGCVFGTPDIAYVLHYNKTSAAGYEPYQVWLSETCAEHQDFMEAMHHRGHPSIVTCRRQTDGTWRVIASRNFLFFGGFSVTEFRTD